MTFLAILLYLRIQAENPSYITLGVFSYVNISGRLADIRISVVVLIIKVKSDGFIYFNKKYSSLDIHGCKG